MRIVALGDSIMWGQGNPDDKKFTSLVARQLGVDIADENQFKSFAHSGATIARTPNDNLSIWGEVPEKGPSILAQLDLAAETVEQPETVDLVLLNGGINDVSVFSIVAAVPFDPTDGAALRDIVHRVFTQDFPALLARARQVFANAKIVVPSYYPILSDVTDPQQLLPLLTHHPAVHAKRAAGGVLTGAVDAAIALALQADHAAMVRQCQIFDTLSRQLMAQAIAGQKGVHFAPVPWEEKNSFAAPQTLLWQGADDPLHGKRVARYEARLATDPFEWPVFTPIASICHPNEAGARVFAEAILGVG